MTCISFAAKCVALVALAVSSNPANYVEAGALCPGSDDAPETPAPMTVTPAPTTVTPAATTVTPAPTTVTPAPTTVTPAPTPATVVQTIVIYTQQNYGGISYPMSGFADTCYTIRQCQNSYAIAAYKLKIPSAYYQDVLFFESADCSGDKFSSNEPELSAEVGNPNLNTGSHKVKSFVFRSSSSASIKGSSSACPQRRLLRESTTN